MAIDHTTLVLPETVPLWRRLRSHRGKKGLGPVAVEFACLFHLVSHAPFFYTLGQAATSDHQLVKKLLPRIRKADLILIDNGLYGVKTFRAIHSRGAHFLVPAKVTHRAKVLQDLGDDDYLCHLQSGT